MKNILKKVLDNIESLVWIFISFIVYIKTNFIKHLLYNNKCNIYFRYLNFVLIGVCMTLLMY